MTTKSPSKYTKFLVAGVATVLLTAGFAYWQQASGGPSTPTLATTPKTTEQHVVSSKEITVYKSPTCGCCGIWEDHLRENGFTVTSHSTEDMATVKGDKGVPSDLSSCHTAVIDGYVVEGHVPAKSLLKLLAEKPDVAGIAVPGMPIGSPGMEGHPVEKYDVISFDSSGTRSVFTRH